MNPRLACAAQIPNGDMRHKSDGAGSVGYPDGWVPSTLYLADLGASKLTHAWEPLQLASGLVDAPPFDTGRCFHLGLKSTAADDAARYIDSPSVPSGQLFGAEQMVAGNYWYYSLGFWFHGQREGGNATTGDFKIQLIAAASSTGGQKIIISHDLLAADFDAAGAWSKKWVYRQTAMGLLDNTGWTGGTGAGPPTTMWVRIIPKFNHAATFLHACFAKIVPFTLGPLETPSGAAATAGLNALQTPYANYYELSRPIQFDPSKPAQFLSGSTLSRRPSMTARRFDPSGGGKAQKWSVVLTKCTEADKEKVVRAWMYQDGYPTDSGTKFGQPRPLAFMWGQGDELDPNATGVPAVHAVWMTKPVVTDVFRASGWQPADRASQLFDLAFDLESA